MKTPAERAHLLLPSTQASMDDKWRAAWSLLDEDKSPAVLPEHRAHAKCWLTYRAIEGHIKHEEFVNRVFATPQFPLHLPLAPRWATSQKAAEFYYFTLHGDDPRSLESISFTRFPEFWQASHPPAVLNYLRVQCVLVYAEYLAGNHDAAKLMIQTALNVWKGVMAALDWRKHPTRFLDAQGDMKPLHAMMCIAARIGTVPEWMQKNEKALIQDCKEPWALCLKHLSKRKGAIWL
jgi:hypothetical protein